MNKKELYKLAINNVQKYSLLNEIFAIRDKRVEQVDYTIGVNGFISLDVLNKYVELIDYINQLETNIDEAIEYIKHSWRLRLDQIYDTSKNLQGWEVEELLSILERGKE